MNFWYLVASSALLVISTVLFSYFIPEKENSVRKITSDKNHEEYLISLMLDNHREFQRWDSTAMMIRDHLLMMESIAEITGNEVVLRNLPKREKEMLDAMRGALISLSPNMNIDLETCIPRWNKGDYQYLEKEKERLGKFWASSVQKRHLKKFELIDNISELGKSKNRLRLMAITLQIIGLFIGFFIKLE